MEITGFDHVVLSCHDPHAMIAFYRDVLGTRAGEERPGKWAIWFGPHKISLQDESSKPSLANQTLPGTGNFCVLSELPAEETARRLTEAGVEILDRGPRQGATGTIDSVYFRDPEGNLVEIGHRIDD